MTTSASRGLTRGPLAQVLIAAVVVAALFGADRGLQAAIDAQIVSDYFRLILAYVGINVIMATSLNLVNGVTGQFSIGHAGFMAIGAYASAFTTTWAQSPHPKWPIGWQVAEILGLMLVGEHIWIVRIALFVASLGFGGLLAAGAGYLVGLPSLRLRGDYLAIVTLGFGEIIRVLILNVDALGGSRGMYGIPSRASIFWIWLFVVITMVALHRIQSSDYGRTLLAIREDEVAAEAMGIDTTGKKVGAFAIAAFFAGVAGGLFAHTLAYLNPSIFTFVKSFDYVVIVILGGMGSMTGAFVGAIILTALLEVLRPSTLASYAQEAGLESLGEWVRNHDFRISIYALILILMMLLRPNGLLGKRELWQLRPFRRLRREGA